MDGATREAVWGQLGAAIDMLENAVRACPDAVWGDRSRNPEFWYVAYHTLFFLDYYTSASGEGFAPPAPFTLSELDPTGLMPERVYTKDEMLGYLAHGREKARAAIAALTGDRAHRRCGFERLDLTHFELALQDLRHVQHHAAQLNLMLRQTTDDAPRWVRRAAEPLETGPARATAQDRAAQTPD